MHFHVKFAVVVFTRSPARKIEAAQQKRYKAMPTNTSAKNQQLVRHLFTPTNPWTIFLFSCFCLLARPRALPTTFPNNIIIRIVKMTFEIFTRTMHTEARRAHSAPVSFSHCHAHSTGAFFRRVSKFFDKCRHITKFNSIFTEMPFVQTWPAIWSHNSHQSIFLRHHYFSFVCVYSRLFLFG